MALALDFDWEQGLFRAARSVWRGLFSTPPPALSDAALALEDRRVRLEVLARLVGGDAVTVRGSQGVGGARGSTVLLPSVLDGWGTLDVHDDLFRLRACVGAVLVREGRRAGGYLDHLRQVHQAVDALSLEFTRIAEIFERCCALDLSRRPTLEGLSAPLARQEEALREALRGGTPWRDPAHQRAFDGVACGVSSVVYGRPLVVELEGADGASAGDALPPTSDCSEAEMEVGDDLTLLSLDEEDVLDLPVHVFEKVETLEAWSGGVRPMDGSDDLDDHLEALEEVDLDKLVRGGERAQAVIRAEIGVDLALPDVSNIAPGERGITYPEWDRGRRSYRPDWATVYPSAVPRGDTRWADEAEHRLAAVRERARARLHQLHDAMRPARRQPDGEDIDLDAVIEDVGSRRAGHGGSERLYRRLQRQPLDLAVTLLLDLSLSSDGWVAGRRVLDVTREAVLIAGGVLDEAGASVRVVAFASQTRNQVRAWDVLDWQEPWAVARGRLGALEPQGYTRIGPAVRHVTAELRLRPERRRLLLLLSDGRPTDYDRYEGRYGTSDVRRAVSDARALGVDVRAIAIDRQHGGELPAICGPGAWTLLHDPEHLPDVLSTLLLQALRR